MIASSLLLVLASPAYAGSAALEPQIRLHAGLSVVGDNLAPFGVTGGLDARLTRLINIDVGGFGSPVAIPETEVQDQDNPTDYFHLRHGVYVAPGIRIPHAQPKALAWDIFFRGGAGVVWSANLEPGANVLDAGLAYPVDPAPAGFAGADLTLRGAKLGVRLSGRAWMYEVTQENLGQSWFHVQGQFGLEGTWQF